MAVSFSVLPSNEKAGAQRRRPAARTAGHPQQSRRSARETRQTRARGRQPSSTRWRRSHGRARTSLQRFRQATILAVALTAIVLLVGAAAEDEVAHAIADKTVGHMMREPIANYRHLLERQRLAYDVHDQPQVYLASPGQGRDAPQ